MIFDLIGYNIKILSHSNPNFIGIQGKIVYETNKFLYILLNSKTKIIKVYKADGIYEIDFKATSKIMVGYMLVGTPIKRIKKKVKLI
ncbi:hypothetical protein DFR86_06810 [Acidianus sulfidivorans JP7]|uniref:Ribonuclease P protein component 1 n=1 Tax=Acidianus sulfidivorans JP7 TaxID=619593 RepID=A0A2U9IMN8_9CREN|nr:ribonuclease P protein subunit [Acidianus sulfidivorans]AWR97291.1 hypothetical protein DFR86_06810 [Acidianus sulfidivorans JP7]